MLTIIRIALLYNLENKFVKEERRMNIDLGKLEREVREAIAKSSFIETEVLEFLSKDESSLVRRNVATNLKSTDTILDSLSKDEDSYVRVEVAKNPVTSGKILNFLSRDEDDKVRFEVARNESTLSETLAHLADDEHPVIRRNVAINKNTLPETLALLGKERYDFGIKYFVAHNPNTPKKVRESLKRNLPKNTWPITPNIEMLCNYYDN